MDLLNRPRRVRTEMRRAPVVGSQQWQQLRILLWKNVKLKSRRLKATVAEVSIPLVLLGLLVWVRSRQDESKIFTRKPGTAPTFPGSSRSPMAPTQSRAKPESLLGCFRRLYSTLAPLSLYRLELRGHRYPITEPATVSGHSPNHGSPVLSRSKTFEFRPLEFSHRVLSERRRRSFDSSQCCRAQFYDGPGWTASPRRLSATGALFSEVTTWTSEDVQHVTHFLSIYNTLFGVDYTVSMAVPPPSNPGSPTPIL